MLINEGLRFGEPDAASLVGSPPREVGLWGWPSRPSDDTRESLSYKLKKILSIHCAGY
jgi:hypothetical protein